MVRIPLARPLFGPEEALAVADVLASGWVAQGPRVQEFERRFAEAVGARHAVAVSSGTAALHLALVVSGVMPGDEVICPSLSFIATANAIVHAGAEPVFAEVSPGTLNLDIRDVERRITPRTRAVLLVHQLGLPADLDGFRALCLRRGLRLVEDAACAAGSRIDGRAIGADPSLACFSFHPRKVITTGEGGMVTTSSPELAERLRRLRQQGMSISDHVRHLADQPMIEQYTEIGFNYRMTDIQAAVGLIQLGRLESLLAERTRIANRYTRALRDIPFLEFFGERSGVTTNHQSFCVYLGPGCPVPRERVMSEMLAEGIATRHGILCAHREAAYASRGPWQGLARSEDLSDRTLMLPLYVPMSDDDADAVIDAFRRAVRC